MKAIATIARRELKALFDQPTGYILVVIFLVINNFLYFRQAFLFHNASLRPMLELLPWLFLFFIPAVTMRSLAEDQRSGIIEIVLAQPVTELDYLLGKYLGQVLFVWSALVLTLAIPMTLSLGADLQLGVVFAQYLGSALLAAGLVAVGVWTSSLTRNQITAFILGVAVMFVFVLVGLDPLLLGLPPVLAAAAARLGVLSHFRDITRGVIDLRDVVYFATLISGFLSLAYYALMRRRLSPSGPTHRRLRLGTAVIVSGLVIVNLFGRHIGGRLDLTPGRAYTLSPATRELVRGLDDLVTIKLFVSKELPNEVALLRRDLDDLLRDYQSAGGGKVRLVVEDPSEDADAESEVRALGIPPIQFNVVGESQFSVRDGYMGLAVQYADQTEIIPFVRKTDDLEYRLSSLIHGMVDTSKVTVGYYVDPSETQLPGSSYNTFRQQLTQSYAIESLNLSGDTIFPANVTVAVLIGSPDSLNTDQREAVRAFLDRGGSLFLAASGMRLGQQEFAMGRSVAWNAALEDYGVSVDQDMAYDLLSNEAVGLRTQFGQVLRPYPLWVRALSTQASPVNQGIESVFLPWSSTVRITDADSATVTALLTTSQAGGVERNAVMLNPNRQFSQDSLARRPLAVLVNPLAVDSPSGPRGRLAVVGSTQFLVDRFFDGNQGTATFALNLIDWLAQDDALISIRAKNRAPPSLVFSSETKAGFVRYLNIIGVPLLVVLAAMVRLIRRRRRTRLTWHPLTASEVA